MRRVMMMSIVGVTMLGGCEGMNGSLDDGFTHGPEEANALAELAMAHDMDAQAPPPTLSISVLGPAIAGEYLEVEIMLPVAVGGVNVFVPITDGGVGAGICPPPLQGNCLEIVGDLVVERVKTAASGIANLFYMVPSNPSTDVLGLQAVIVTANQVYMSEPLVVGIASDDDQDGDGYDNTVDCDDANPAAWILEGPVVSTLEQADVETFCESYCTRTVSGDVTLDSATATNLASLNCLTTVGGDLLIVDSEALTSVDGLSNVGAVGGLSIVGNGSLTDIGALAGLAEIDGDLEIGNNGLLAEIDGLAGISSVNGGLDIYNNGSLTNVNGLTGITSGVDYLVIQDNDVLADLRGLANISSVGDTLTITDNPSLCQSLVDDFVVGVGLTPSPTVGGVYTVFNDAGC